MLGCILLVGTLGTARAAGTVWSDLALPPALELARREHKWVLIDVYATWCVPCHKMDEEVYPREEVARAIAGGFVALRRDGEAGEGVAIVQRYHVVGYPTLLVLDAKGNEVDRIMGGLGAAELVLRLAHLRDGSDTLARLEKQLERAPTDALRLEVATRQAMRGDPRAVVALRDVVNGDSENRARRAAAALLTLGKYYYLRGARDYAHAESVLLELERRFPKTEEASQAAYARAIALEGLGRHQEAMTLLDEWVAHAPKDRDRVAAYAWFCFKEGGDKSRGIEVARRGLEAFPNDDSLWDTLGELYLSMGKTSEARAAFARAAELVPKSDYYRRQLSKVGGTP